MSVIRRRHLPCKKKLTDIQLESNMSNYYTKHKIHSIVASASNVIELIPLLKHVPIAEIKQLINQSVDKMNTSSIRKIHLNSLSIHETIPDAVILLIQHILSFHSIDEINMKLVNRKWNKLSELNERNYYSQLIKRLDQHSPISYKRVTPKTYLINPKRKELSRIETELGF